MMNFDVWQAAVTSPASSASGGGGAGSDPSASMYGNPHQMYQHQMMAAQGAVGVDAGGYTLQTLGAAPMGGASAGAGSMAPPSWTGAPGGMMAPEAANVTATPPSGDTSEESGDDSNSMAQVINKVGSSFSFLFFSFLFFSFLSFFLVLFFLIPSFPSSFHPFIPFLPLHSFSWIISSLKDISTRIISKESCQNPTRIPSESILMKVERISKNPTRIISKESQRVLKESHKNQIKRILKNHLERISKNPKESHKNHLERISKNLKES